MIFRSDDAMSVQFPHVARREAHEQAGVMSKDARELAALYYAGSGRSLAADVAALCRNPRGIVMSTPRLFALMRPVCSRRPESWAEHLSLDISAADAWYVHLLAGDLQLAFQLGHTLPPLPLLCFQRGSRSGRPHRLSWRRVLNSNLPFDDGQAAFQDVAHAGC